jgi:hypothetical protein
MKYAMDPLMVHVDSHHMSTLTIYLDKEKQVGLRVDILV